MAGALSVLALRQGLGQRQHLLYPNRMLHSKGDQLVALQHQVLEKLRSQATLAKRPRDSQRVITVRQRGNDGNTAVITAPSADDLERHQEAINANSRVLRYTHSPFPFISPW